MATKTTKKKGGAKKAPGAEAQRQRAEDTAAAEGEEPSPPQDEEGTAPENQPEQVAARSPAGSRAAAQRAEFEQKDRERANEQAREAAAASEEGRPAKTVAPAADAGGETRRYLLLGGVHTENGKDYTYDRDRPVVVESNRPLDELFMNKFRALDGPTSPGRDFRDAADRPGLLDAPLAVRKPYGEASPFSRDMDLSAQQTLARKRAGTDVAVGDADLGPAAAAAPGYGEDVTEFFDGADKADAKVFKRGGEYRVFDADKPDKPLHAEPLTSKGDVDEFLSGL